MKVLPYLDAIVSQAEFAQMIGVSEASISKRVSDGVLVRGETAHEWLIAYCEHLRDQAAGRIGSNLNQIARWCNTHCENADAVQVLAALVAIDQALTSFSYRPSPPGEGAVNEGDYINDE